MRTSKEVVDGQEKGETNVSWTILGSKRNKKFMCKWDQGAFVIEMAMEGALQDSEWDVYFLEATFHFYCVATWFWTLQEHASIWWYVILNKCCMPCAFQKSCNLLIGNLCVSQIEVCAFLPFYNTSKLLGF
jgi:hypothetical protein